MFPDLPEVRLQDTKAEQLVHQGRRSAQGAGGEDEDRKLHTVHAK